MRRAELTAGMLALLLGVTVLAGCGGGGEEKGVRTAREAAPAEEGPEIAPTRPLPPGVTPKTAAQGRKLYPATCAACHGPQAEGTQLGPSLRDAEWLAGSGELPEIEQAIRDGVPEPQEFPVPMPPHGGGAYTAEELRALAAYVYSISQSP